MKPKFIKITIEDQGSAYIRLDQVVAFGEETTNEVTKTYIVSDEGSTQAIEEPLDWLMRQFDIAEYGAPEVSEPPTLPEI